MTDPYTPPGAPVRDPRSDRKGSPVKAVILGVLTDIGGTFVVSVAISAIFAAQMAGAGANEQEITSALANMPRTSWVYITGFVLGGLCSIAGGYVCARLARHSEYGLGAIVAVSSMVFGLYAASEQYPVPGNVGLAALTFVLVMIGVRLGVAKNRRA